MASHDTVDRSVTAPLEADEALRRFQRELKPLTLMAQVGLRQPRFDLAAELDKPWVRSWFALESGRPVGFLIAWHVADELHVLSVVVDPEAQRRGHASKMMEAALHYARTHAVRLVLLEVRRNNRPAIQLYRGLRFSAVGVRPNYYEDTREDAIEMMLVLDPETGFALPTKDEVGIEV